MNKSVRNVGVAAALTLTAVLLLTVKRVTDAFDSIDTDSSFESVSPAKLGSVYAYESCVWGDCSAPNLFVRDYQLSSKKHIDASLVPDKKSPWFIAWSKDGAVVAVSCASSKAGVLLWTNYYDFQSHGKPVRLPNKNPELTSHSIEMLLQKHGGKGDNIGVIVQ